MYEALKLLANRFYQCSVDEYLSKFGLRRESLHAQASENVIYLSERDMEFYGFRSLNDIELKECNISELNPREYCGIYCKLIAQGLDALGVNEKHEKEQ